MPSRVQSGSSVPAQSSRDRLTRDCRREELEDRHLGGIETAGDRRDREQDGPAARERFRPQVIGFTLRAVGPRQNRRRSTPRSDLLQAGVRGGGRETRSPSPAPAEASRALTTAGNSALRTEVLDVSTPFGAMAPLRTFLRLVLCRRDAARRSRGWNKDEVISWRHDACVKRRSDTKIKRLSKGEHR